MPVKKAFTVWRLEDGTKRTVYGGTERSAMIRFCGEHPGATVVGERYKVREQGATSEPWVWFSKTRSGIRLVHGDDD
jgi:hypothetical protein